MVEMDVGFLQAQMDESDPDMQWSLLARHDVTMNEFTYSIMGAMKTLSNKTLPPNFNSAVFSLLDNRPVMAGK